MNRPISIIDHQGATIAPPEGVEYSGCRAVGPYLVLRFTDLKVRVEPTAEGELRSRTYLDRFYDGNGKEQFRETGEVSELIPTPLTFWQRLWQ